MSSTAPVYANDTYITDLRLDDKVVIVQEDIIEANLNFVSSNSVLESHRRWHQRIAKIGFLGTFIPFLILLFTPAYWISFLLLPIHLGFLGMWITIWQDRRRDRR